VVYALIEHGEKVVLTAYGASESRPRENWSEFFEPYETAHDITSVFENEQPVVHDGEDHFGPYRSVLIPLRESNGDVFVVAAEVYIHEVNEKLRQTLRHSIAIAVVPLVLVVLVSIGLSARITRPVMSLAAHTRRLADDDFQPDSREQEKVQEIADRSGDEVSELAESFVVMENRLESYLEELERETAARERIESELEIARKIQEGFLPRNFSPFPDQPRVDLYAMMDPAKQVGGDLYDFFFIDPDHLCFFIGDVSDKGVPASLFMTVTKTLLRSTASRGLAPEAILTEVNQALCAENDTGQFVTVFCGILTISTGDLVVADAGHNPPFLVDSRRFHVGMIGKDESGTVLGIFDELHYSEKPLHLDPGDTFFLYTDGVPEAQNTEDELYETGRMQAVFAKAGENRTARELIELLYEDVTRFTEGAPQSDDITMLAVRFV